MTSPITVTCDYCGGDALLTDSAEVYDGRSFGLIWLCRPCKAYVGCHRGTEKPLGRLANAELRGWKIKAHAAFDALWKGKMRRDQCNKKTARNAGYKWLAKALEIDFADCHIGMMDVQMCKRVIEVCSSIGVAA